MPSKTPAKRATTRVASRSTTKKSTKRGLLSRLGALSKRGQFLLFIAVFAALGGGIYAYRSFAYVERLACAGKFPNAINPPNRNDRSRLNSGQTLQKGQSLGSPIGNYSVHLWSNGNLEVYRCDGQLTWHARYAADNLTMQTDSNLVLYKGSTAKWSTQTWNTGTNPYLRIQDDGNLVVYNNRGAAWSSKYGRHQVPPKAVTAKPTTNPAPKPAATSQYSIYSSCRRGSTKTYVNVSGPANGQTLWLTATHAASGQYSGGGSLFNGPTWKHSKSTYTASFNKGTWKRGNFVLRVYVNGKWQDVATKSIAACY